MAYQYENVKLEKGMYGQNGRSFLKVLESLDPSENYKGTALEGLDAFQRQLKRLQADTGQRVGGDLQRFHAQPLEGLHGAMKARRIHSHDIPRLAHRANTARQRLVTARGDHQFVRP